MTPQVRHEAVSPQQAADLMSVSKTTILRLIRSKKLKAIRVGRQWRIKLTDLKKGTQAEDDVTATRQ